MTAGAETKGWWTSWWIPAFVGLISLVAGVLAILWPGVTLLALALITGINLVVLSAFMIGTAIADDEARSRTLQIVVGVLGVIAGLVVMRRPGETLLVLILALGIWLVLDGVVEIVRAFLPNTEHRALTAVSGVIDGILGAVILAWPEFGLGTVAVLIGIGFVIRGVTLMVGGWRSRHVAHELDTTFTGSPTPPAPAV